jgi:hypothetical protein
MQANAQNLRLLDLRRVNFSYRDRARWPVSTQLLAAVGGEASDASLRFRLAALGREGGRHGAGAPKAGSIPMTSSGGRSRRATAVYFRSRPPWEPRAGQVYLSREHGRAGCHSPSSPKRGRHPPAQIRRDSEKFRRRARACTKGRVIAVQFDAMGCGLRQAALPTDVQPPVIAA